MIEDLRLLLEKGFDIDDVYTCDNFKLRAMLFCIINDNLSGYNVKGYKACPICKVDTCHHQLQNGKDTVYVGHREFLRPNHPYHRLWKAFNGEQEFDVAPNPLNGKEVYRKQQHIKVVFRKKQKKYLEKNIWKKRLVFFDIPYGLVLM